MGLIGCPETSVTNYQSTLRNIPEEQRPRNNDNCEDVLATCHVYTRETANYMRVFAKDLQLVVTILVLLLGWAENFKCV